MLGAYFSLLILLVVVAAMMRDDFALTLIYLLVGAFAAGTWWSRRGLSQVQHERRFTGHAFLGEKVAVSLQLSNKSWLPILWLDVRDALPVALGRPDAAQRVISLGPYGSSRFEYLIETHKRGYYPVGPAFLSSGDILGLNDPLRRQGAVEYLTVYPKIVPLTSVKIPSNSPQGTLRHTQPVFEDPTRTFGKRDYLAGDSLRRVDWKSSAATGRLQVKLFEPSIALETLLLLNLNADDYHFRSRIDSIELAIVIAASLGNWIAAQRQTVGLKVNGRDPLAGDGVPQYLPPRKGQAHLMRILETLARVEPTQAAPLAAVIQEQRYHLAWGTTMLVITGQAGDDLLDEIFQARRAGQNAVLILAGQGSSAQETQYKARFFGIPVVSIFHERDLDIWRK